MSRSAYQPLQIYVIFFGEKSREVSLLFLFFFNHITPERLIGRSAHHLKLERLIGISAHFILNGQICLGYGYVSSNKYLFGTCPPVHQLKSWTVTETDPCQCSWPTDVNLGMDTRSLIRLPPWFKSSSVGFKSFGSSHFPLGLCPSGPVVNGMAIGDRPRRQDNFTIKVGHGRPGQVIIN